MSNIASQLRERRQGIWQQAKDLADAASERNRAFTGDEQSRFQSLNAELDALDERIKGIHDGEQRARDTETAFATVLGDDHRYRPRAPGEDELEQRFRDATLNNDRRPIDIRPTGGRTYRQPGIEYRDLVTTAPANMFGVSFYDRIIEHLVENSSVLAAGGTLVQTESGEPLRVPRSTALSTAGIVTEGGTIPESDPTISSASLGAYQYGFRVEVSYEMAQDSGFDLMGYLAREAGQAIGLGLGAHLITGTGTGQPTGVLTTATSGVSGITGTATSFGAQGTVGQGSDILNNLWASVAEPYTRQRGTGWLMRSSELGLIRSLKAPTTGELVGNLILGPPTVKGAAATLLGAPVFVDPAMPAAANTNEAIAFGDWSRYFMRQAGPIRFQQSEDFAFDRDMVTFRALGRFDGALIDASAIKTFAHAT